MTTPKGRILFAEDDADTRELITYVLSAEGYEVQCTQNADEAIAVAHEQQFDLFLFDTWMPSISGADLTRKLRKFDIKTPVLFYSGAGFESDKADATSAAAQGYLVKPAKNEDLINEVARLIAEASITVQFKVVAPKPHKNSRKARA